MKKTKEAFIWIIKILKTHKIPYIISGGFAARIYGSKRLLVDIDIVVPDKSIDKILPYVQEYVTKGPIKYKDKEWDIYLMTLNYKGQKIDLSGADTEKIFDKKNKQWVKSNNNFSNVTKKRVYGKVVNIVKKKELINYKNIIHRRVDIKDIKYLSIK